MKASTRSTRLRKNKLRWHLHSDWLRERSLFPSLITEVPHNNTGIIIVIPAYDEPGIARVLDSLAGCEKPKWTAEVIIIINAPGDATGTSLENNRRTIENILSWKRINTDVLFRLFYADLGQPAIKKWGVGLARKAGMDEALRRFDLIDNPGGVIANLDGDCTVERGYFRALEKELLNTPGKESMFHILRASG
ncbi:MAG: glycosyltransferase family 2 protein [Ignavibacteriales bacterium]|nr:glycosyltransferase family 2 protein [Ignavibacteriales bacterium]